MSEVVTGVGCRTCPKGARFACFNAMKEKADFWTCPDELAELFFDDEVPVWQTFEDGGKELHTHNEYADPNPILALCPNGMKDDRPLFDCPIEDQVERRVRILEEAGHKRITGEA